MGRIAGSRLLCALLLAVGCGNAPPASNCPEGQAACGGTCVDPRVDPAHCGGCGAACREGEKCVDGKCALSCPMGQSACAGACVNVMTDTKHCGACAMACPMDQVCMAGKCAATCSMGLTECGGACVDLQKDAAHCGACKAACPMGRECLAGKCSCPMGKSDCGGACVDLQVDPAHCGACGMACPNGQVCGGGKCGCPMGKDDCGGACVDLQADAAHCGGCGKACGMMEGCVAGKCVLMCKAPEMACGNRCVDPQSDVGHCGGCDKACTGAPNAGVKCAMGMCAFAGCNMGFGDCDMDQMNGCETDHSSNAKHCGACGKACAANVEACCNGGCIPVMQDGLNCGACGKACGMNQKCCGGVCLDPKFSMLMSFDCKKPFNAEAVQGDQFNKTGMVDQLVADMAGLKTLPPEMKPPPAQSPYVWIAMHSTHQVNKVDAKTGDVLGTYGSGGQQPSRVAVALDNSVWVGNRGTGGVNNPAISNASQILPDGTLRCRVGTSADGKPMPFVRAIAIDASGYVWAGSWNDHRVHKIDPATCENGKAVLDFDMTTKIGNTTYTSYPYGLAVDRKGILWNSNLGGGNHWFGIDVNANPPVVKYVVPHGNRQSYGVVIDLQGNIYFGNYAPCNGGVHKIDASKLDPNKVLQDAAIVSTIAGTPGGCTRGITLDGTGNVWAAVDTNPGRVHKFEGGTGKFLASHTFAGVYNSVGIAGDTFGRVWVTGRNTNNLMRFNPADGKGDFMAPKKLPGNECYNYSDWNAIVLKTVTANNAQAGTWTRLFDSGSAMSRWASATWDANTPKGTSVAVYFKAASDPMDFPKLKTCGPFYSQPVDLDACMYGPSRYLQVIVVLNTTDVNVRPSLDNLRVYWQ